MFKDNFSLNHSHSYYHLRSSFDLPPVPDQPPAGITAQAASSTSLTVSWNSVPLGHENGVVTGYTVFYIDVNETQPKLNISVECNVSSVEVTSLLVYTNYCIQVLAFTSKGDGNISGCLITLTGEGGKKNKSLVISQGIYLSRVVLAVTINFVLLSISPQFPTSHQRDSQHKLPAQPFCLIDSGKV